MGGSYATYTGRQGISGLTGFALNTDGELFDSSGRRIITDSYTNGGDVEANGGGAARGAGLLTAGAGPAAAGTGPTAAGTVAGGIVGPGQQPLTGRQPQPSNR